MSQWIEDMYTKEVAQELAREEGRADGRTETLNTTAMNLLSEGVPVEIIAKCTGLTIEQIQSLK